MKFDYIRKIFRSTLFVINIITLLSFLLSAFSDRVSPNTMMFFAYLGLGFPFILFVNILFTIWWILMRNWKFLSVNIIVFVICSSQIFSYLPINAKTKNVPEDCIKVLTYNVMRYNQYKKHTKENPNDIIGYILDLDADIVCVQEYGAAHSKSLITKEEIDAIFKKKYPYRKTMNTYETDNSMGGNAIYSKFPIKSFKKIPFENNSEYNTACAAELEIQGKNVLLINAHLESNKLSVEDRDKYEGIFRGIKDFDSKKIEDASDMMRKRLSVSYRIRAKQAEAVAKWIQNSSAPYIIVCGDFNDTPISYSRHTVKGNLLKDAFAETGLGLGISYNQNRFWFRIDYIMHSKNIEAYNCTVGKLKDSDHYPVWTYLQLK